MTRPERAVRADAAEILALYRAAAKAANQSGHSHWDEDYPNTETIREDIENGYLYIWREDGKIVAAITFMHPYDLDGLGISWTPVKRAVEACRFCLAPSKQGKGRARAYFLSGIELLREQGVEAMRYLCACENIAAYRIYTGLGHRQLEDTQQHGVAFHSFEALLQGGTARTDGEDADEGHADSAEDADEDLADVAEDADASDALRRPTARQLRSVARDGLCGKWLPMALIMLVLLLVSTLQLDIDTSIPSGPRFKDGVPVAVEEAQSGTKEVFLQNPESGPQEEYFVELSADLGPLTRTHTFIWLRRSALLSHVPDGPDASNLLAAWADFFRADPVFWLVSLVLTLLSLLFTPALLLGMYEALHTAFAGERPRLRQLFCRLRQWPRALWASVLSYFISGAWLYGILLALTVAFPLKGASGTAVALLYWALMLALVVRNILVRYRYAMACYLLWKMPQLRARESLRLSRVRMRGDRAALFRLRLSYLGWILLASALPVFIERLLRVNGAAPALRAALAWLALIVCDAFCSGYIYAGDFAFFRSLEMRKTPEA